MARTRSHDPTNKQILDEAAAWFVEFSTGEPDARARCAFDAWLRKSPEHLRAYLGMFPIWEDAQGIDAAQTANADELIALARSAESNVVPLGPGSERHFGSSAARRTRSKRLLAIAASVLVTLACLASWFVYQRGLYATGIGEQRVITLDDGSSIEINARSRVRLEFSALERRVRLLAGQALFRVARDEHRPFIVESGATEVRAIGTQFDVNRKRSGTTVTVVEGRVAVHSATHRIEAGGGQRPSYPGVGADAASPDGDTRPADHAGATPTATPGHGVTLEILPGEILLAAGEQLTITPSAIARPAAADIASVTAWRHRRLVFSSTPLTEVADEFNRYNERQLIVSPELESFNISAVFNATDIPSLLRFLRAQPNVIVEEGDRQIRIASEPR